MKRSVAYLMMFLHVVFAAGNYVLAKPATEEFADPEALALLRALTAGVLVVLLSGRWIPRPRFKRREWVQVGALGALLVIGNQYVFLRGLEDTAPAHAALLYATTPAAVLVLSSLLARRLPALLRVVGVAIALAGVLLLMRPWETGAEAGIRRGGNLWIALGVCMWAGYTVAAGRMTRRHDARTVTAWSLAIGALCLLPIGMPSLIALDVSNVSVRGCVGIAYLIVVTSVVMMLLWNTMLRYLEPVQVAICANAQPAATGLLAAALAAVGYLTSAQDLGWLFWAGTALVVAGITLVQRPEKVRAIAPPA